jgi:PilZ domain
MEPKGEKRRIQRSGFPQTVRLDLIQEESNQIKNERRSAQGVDISSQGLGLVTPFPLQQGQVIRISLPAKESPALLPVFSEVRWVKGAGKEYRLGVQFLG